VIASFVVSSTGCAKKPDTAKPELVAWHWLSDRTEAFEYLAKEYKKQTGVNVTFELRFELYAPTSAYVSKIRAAAQANKLPDIYGVLMEMRDFASLIKAGHILNLSSYMDADNGAWKSTFYKGGLIMNTFPEGNQYEVTPGIYGVPLDMNNIQMIYNTDLLKMAGWDPGKIPSTWDEFIAMGDALKKAGIPGMVSGWGEPWMIHCFADNFAWNIMGQEKVLATIKGDVPYTDPDWVKVFNLFKQMKEHGLLSDGIVTMINKEAEQTFANERAALAFNGSWCINIYDSMNPNIKYKVALPPRINLQRPMYVWGGTTSFVVNAKSPLKDEAVKFLKWLSEEKQQRYLAKQTLNIPANRKCADMLSGHTAEFAAAMDNVVHPRLLPLEEYPLVTEAFDKGIQSILIGEATPEEVAKTVQEAKVREMEKSAMFKAQKQKQQEQKQKQEDKQK
jgi:ABC-type glycerol-3-phosphate transport system substrate-binding protein